MTPVIDSRRPRRAPAPDRPAAPAAPDREPLGNLFALTRGLDAVATSAGVSVPLLRGADIVGRDRVTAADATARVSLARSPAPDYLLREGDLVLGAAPASPAADSAVAVYAGGAAAAFAGGLVRLRPVGDRVDVGFARHALLAKALRPELARLLPTGTPDPPTIARLAELRLPLPPLATQRRIAAVLATWAEAIALTERYLRDLTERRRGLAARPPDGPREAAVAAIALHDEATERLRARLRDLDLQRRGLRDLLLGEGPEPSARLDEVLGLGTAPERPPP